METIGSKRSYALTWCMPNNNDDDDDDDDIITQSNCMSSPGSHHEYRTASDGCQPLNQADGPEPLARL